MLANEKIAGFAMVNDYPAYPADTNYTMSEFCVLYPYRKCGIGFWAATELFRRFPGKWQLKRHPCNTGSVAFWNCAVSALDQNYRIVPTQPGGEYADGTPGEVLLFDTGASKEAVN